MHVTRVVVRNATGLRLVAILPGLIAFGLTWGIVDSIVHLDPRRDLSGVSGPVGTTIAWIIVLTFWLLTTGTVLVLVGMRQVFTREGVTVRTLVRSHHLALADVAEITVDQMPVHTGSPLRVIPVAELRVLPDRQRSRVRAAVNGNMTHLADALAVLDVWVRKRPGIVQQDEAREVFASRGVLTAKDG